MDEIKEPDQFTPKPIPGPNTGAQVGIPASVTSANPPSTTGAGLSPAKPATTPPPAGEEKIVVKKSVLDKILADQEAQQKKNSDLEATVALLLGAADKGRLAHVQAASGKAIIHTYRLRTFPIAGVPMVIIKWKLIEDIMEKDGRGIWRESQIVKIWTEDGKEFDMPVAQFERVAKIVVKEISQKKVDVLGDEKVYYTVETSAGKQYEVEAPFIN